MRCRHFLNPLLSPLSFAKPPSRPLASRARAVAQPPAQAQRRAALAEPDVGISRFASSLPGFRGVLKQRYSDFVVHEVARDGTLVRLTSFDLPDERADTDDEANADLPHALDSFRLLCGDADAEALRGFLSRVSEGDSNVSPIILSPDADKAHRLEVHDFFKRNFIFLVTDTVEHSDGVQRCIRVRLRSGPRGRRNVGEKASNRTGIGSSEPSGWRDDMPFDSRGSITWPYHLGKFLRFHLYKENKDTQEALRVIGKMLGLQPRSFRIAGTKDKRAITTQQVTLFKVHASRLAALNNKLTGIKVGDFNYVKEGLVLGQLMGNRFTITLRSVIAESEDVIKAAVDGLIKSGFINYYGLQRFGSASVPTHLVGAALLRGEWRSAVSLILDPREGEYDDMNGVREHYKEHGDIDVAIRNFPRRLIAERAILQRLKKYPGNYLQALMAIPRTLRLMYVHSYQSYLWNHAASMRAGIYGLSGVIEGDLVYKKECLGEGTLTDTSKNNDDHTIASEMDIFVETLPEETIQSVKIADSEDLLKAVYTLEDVVLPLPGSETLFPGNEVAGIYHEIANKDGISLTKSIHGVKDVVTYTDDKIHLVETDLDVLSKAKPSEVNELLSTRASHDGSLDTSGATILAETESTGSSDLLPELAVKLSFTLPTSSYATMAIRELTKTSTSVDCQKALNS
ncbi:pseudouridylate synthase 7 homolog isoform X3 [Hordeum vulgare subsp. vulgare]|uniref:pseudouridylate synthase 7 homolog isoform X3 n=1 Tax=Hordeum vulgare subsp. vulgare TaxID=112509 RepID=UPI001D1A4395|nr:pseudouridylate synthase 7 homolog isoform X3 [Hordeum vulgare subsp. vulgare]